MPIQSKKVGERQRGQAVIIFVAAFTVLLGMTGVAVDFGFYYANRTQTQNAAAAGALAGVQALGRHYLYTTNGGAGNTLGLSDYTDAQIQDQITYAAAADIPTFTDLGTSQSATPTWPSGTGNSLTAYYLVPGQNGTPSQGAQVGSASTPTNAVGVRVEARLRRPTLFASVLGEWATHMDVYASARALLQSVGGPQNGPFIVCGGGGSTGAYRVKNANGAAPPNGTFDVLLAGSPPTVDYSYAGNWYLVHSSQLASPESGNSSTSSACGNTNASWKGSAASTLCQPTGSTPLPCTQATVNGDRSGPLANAVGGMAGCDPGSLDNCVVFLEITNACGGSSCTVVAYAPFYIKAGLPPTPNVNVSGCNTSNCHTAQLLKDTMCGAGCGAPAGSFNPNNPGIFTYNLVPDS